MPSNSVYAPHFHLLGLAPIIEVAEGGVVAGLELFRRRAALHLGRLGRQTRVGCGKRREARIAIGAFVTFILQVTHRVTIHRFLAWLQVLKWCWNWYDVFSKIPQRAARASTEVCF